jgi:hypothetical protein
MHGKIVLLAVAGLFTASKVSNENKHRCVPPVHNWACHRLLPAIL